MKHGLSIGAPAPVAQESKLQLVDASKKPVKRAHQVPSTLTGEMRLAIVGQIQAGRSVPQTAKEYAVREVVALELWIREEVKRGSLRRAA